MSLCPGTYVHLAFFRWQSSKTQRLSYGMYHVHLSPLEYETYNYHPACLY